MSPSEVWQRVIIIALQAQASLLKIKRFWVKKTGVCIPPEIKSLKTKTSVFHSIQNFFFRNGALLCNLWLFIKVNLEFGSSELLLLMFLLSSPPSYSWIGLIDGWSSTEISNFLTLEFILIPPIWSKWLAHTGNTTWFHPSWNLYLFHMVICDSLTHLGIEFHLYVCHHRVLQCYNPEVTSIR